MKKLIVITLLISALCTACNKVNNSTKINPTDLSSENKEETLSQNEQIQQTNQEGIIEKVTSQDTAINNEKEVENLHPIDKAERDCISKVDSTVAMNACGYKAMDAWFKEIDKYITLLKNVTSEEEYANILKAQENWKKYQESEFVAISIIINKQGTIYQNILSGEERGLVRQRAQDLKNFYDYLIE